MKTKIIILGLLAITTIGGFAQIVRDRNTTNQLKSVEFMQWKFTPKWYYALFHNKYRRTQKNNIQQTVPALGATELAKNYTEKEEEKYNIIYQQESFKFIDRSVDIVYQSTEEERNMQINRIQRNLNLLSNSDIVAKLETELERIITNIDIIHKSHIDNANKRQSYLAYNKELAKLAILTEKLKKIEQCTN